MFGSAVLRRSAALLVAIVLSYAAGVFESRYRWIWGQLDHWENLLVLLLTVVVVGILVWVYHTPASRRLAVLGIVVVSAVCVFATVLFLRGHANVSVLMVPIALVVLGALWVWNIMLKSPTRLAAFWQARRISAVVPTYEDTPSSSVRERLARVRDTARQYTP